jgi:hypothetical protein
MFNNQPQNLKMPSIAHNFANTTQNQTKLLPKEVKYQELSNNMLIKAI